MDEYFPRGESAVCAMPVSPIMPCAPVTTLVAASFESDAHQERGDHAEGNADRERGEQMDAHFRDGRIDQKQAAESEERDAANGEHTVGGEFGFGGEKREGGKNQDQRGKARGQQVQGESRQTRMKTTPTVPGTTAPG